MRPARFHLYFDWELAIPFVPWMIWVYLSLQVFLALPLFVLDSAGISRFGQAFTLATLAAAAIHLTAPTDLGWPRPAAVVGYPIFERLFSIDRPHNLAPSLHIVYSALAFMAIWSTLRCMVSLAGVLRLAGPPAPLSGYRQRLRPGGSV
jgi:hypothetical protein